MRFDLRANADLRAARLRGLGCPVVFTGAPALSGTYSAGPGALDILGKLARDAACGLGLPGGAATVGYPDQDAATRHFTAAQIQALYRAVRDYAASLGDFGAGHRPHPPPHPPALT